MEDIKCIFCNKESNNILIKENGYLGRKCSTCNLIYISPRPTLNEIVNLYSHDEANISAVSHIKGDFIKTIYAKHHLKIIKRYIGKGKLLDIGAGAGYFLKEARQQGFDVYGIEFNKDQTDFIMNSLKIRCERSPLSEELFDFGKFDVIYHCDVISHLYDPINDFKIMNHKLNESGFVIFETGNLGDISSKYLKYFTKFQYPDHLFFYSEANIKTLLEQTGFELVKIYRFSILPQLFFTKALLKLKDFIKSENKKTNVRNQPAEILSGTEKKDNNNDQTKQRMLKKIYSFMMYFIRYKLGAIIPKREIPQTIIVIAKKKVELIK